MNAAAWKIMLEALCATAVLVSLHSDDPGDTGTHEIAGGAPAYHRTLATWGLANTKTIDIAEPIDFDYADATVKFAGLWSADGAQFYTGVAVDEETAVGQGVYHLSTCALTGIEPPAGGAVVLPDPLWHLDATELALADGAAVASWDGGGGYVFPENGGTDGVYHADIAAINDKAAVELPNAGLNFEHAAWGNALTGDGYGSIFIVSRSGSDGDTAGNSEYQAVYATNGTYPLVQPSFFQIQLSTADSVSSLGRIEVSDSANDIYSERVIPPVGDPASNINDFHLFEVHITPDASPEILFDGTGPLALTDFGGTPIASPTPITWLQALASNPDGPNGYIDVLPYSTQLAEMVVYSGTAALTDEQKAQARSDLLAKYGL